ncbi:FliH/SctL family protein [Bombella saccharophila]|uniref:Flagellar assembly protein FliH/Type III secretion system HrpE domain-containing protein n=1 Tax=Bombella saccharophila TaxID=2967338 RepID=A0ABT3WDB2_9PROT|nr:hypothetical protein [Bombella saccharophila]MCX5614936.1 hypothetical protein [Bombella saccharophila]PHI96356.1 hypothetical protein BG621_05255 [Parasaccharibacter apium]
MKEALKQAATPERWSFSESLEDFSHHAKDVVGELLDEEEPEPDPSITLHPEELERLKAEAYQQGYKQGEGDAEQALGSQMAESVQQVLAFMEEEEARRNDRMMRLSEQFVAGVCHVVEQIFAGDLAQTGLRHQLAEDAAMLVAQCEGAIELACATADESALRTALAGVKDVAITAEPGRQAGSLTISAAQSRITLDETQWAEAVRHRVAEAVEALIRLAPTGEQEAVQDVEPHIVQKEGE